jgi:hypothetical protein
MPASKQTVTARLQFMTWLKKTNPGLYREVVKRADASTLGAAENGEGETSWWQKAVAGLATVGTTYLTLKNQRDAMKINLQRAQQELPPIDMGDSAPVVRTQIDLPPDVITKITTSADTNINKMLLFGAAAVAAIMLFMNR